MLAFFLRLAARPGVLLFCVALAMVGALAVQTSRVSRLRAQLQAARAAQIDPKTQRPWRVEAQEAGSALEACSVLRDGLAQSLRRQNGALMQIRTEAATATARASAAAAAARGDAATARHRAAQALAAERGVDACRSADALILRSVNP